MRKEASLEQWKILYEAATRIREMKPWEKLWDTDLIGVKYGSEEDTVFFSILGHGGDCYGISVYEGYEGLNTLMMLMMQERLNLSPEYTMFHQRSLTCYWGNREELTDKQRKIIKELGYSYRGKNQWLYFLSYEPGYFPYNLDENEVLKMSGYLQDLESALNCYDKIEGVDFENGNMFLLSFSEDKRAWNFGKEPLPFTCFQFGNLVITDEELIAELKKAAKGRTILEADVFVPGAKITDKEYDRPASPSMVMIGEAVTGMILKCDLTKPDEDPVEELAWAVIHFIFQAGAPKEIRVTNVIMEAGLRQICELCGIKLRRVKRLKALEEFKRSLSRFR